HIARPVRVGQVTDWRCRLQCAGLTGHGESLVGTANQPAQEHQQVVGCRYLCRAGAIHSSGRNAAGGRIEGAGIPGGKAWSSSGTQNVVRNEGLTKGPRPERGNGELLVLTAKAHGVLAVGPNSVILHVINIGGASLGIKAGFRVVDKRNLNIEAR